MSNIYKLDTAQLSDIPKLLRSMADHIEEGTYGNVVAGVVVLEDNTNQLTLFGLGAATDHRSVSILAGAQQTLIQKTFGRLKPEQ
jgi:hypothetical protein